MRVSAWLGLTCYIVLACVLPSSPGRAWPGLQALLLSALLKVYLLEPSNESLRREAHGLFERYRRIMDPELQQRAAEYMVRALVRACAGCWALGQGQGQGRDTSRWPPPRTTGHARSFPCGLWTRLSLPVCL